jgi:hypothetical protein
MLPWKVVEPTHQTPIGSAVFSFVIPSAAEGSAVLRTRVGNVFFVNSPALFTLDSAEKQFYKSVAIGSQAHSCIRLQYRDPFDFVVISVQNILLV